MNDRFEIRSQSRLSIFNLIRLLHYYVVARDSTTLPKKNGLTVCSEHSAKKERGLGLCDIVRVCPRLSLWKRGHFLC